MVYFIENLGHSSKTHRHEVVPKHHFTPRPYQVEIIDAAVSENTVVCLSAGTGKLFIAVTLIKELSFQIRDKKHQKYTLLVLDYGCNLEEQVKHVSLHTNLSVSLWSSSTEAGSHHVYIMTGVELMKALMSSAISLTDTNLLIFDECHKALQEEHSYAKLMQLYAQVDVNQRPRILGLTTNVLNSRAATPEDLLSTLNSLEAALCSRARVATDLAIGDVYGAKPQEIILECEDYEDKTGLVEEISYFLEGSLIFLEDCASEINEVDPRSMPRAVIREIQEVLQILGPWAASKVAESILEQLIKLNESTTDAAEKIYINHVASQLRMLNKVVERFYERKVETQDDFMTYISPKVLKLVEFLRQYKPDDCFEIICDGLDMDADTVVSDSDDSLDLSQDELSADEGFSKKRTDKSENQNKKDPLLPSHYVVKKVDSEGDERQILDPICAIVFVQRNHVALGLNLIIQELCNWDVDLYFLKSCHIVGSSFEGNSSIEEMRQEAALYRQQEEVLRAFRNREYNLLVATNMLEEGVDIPRCNVIVRFDPPHDYRSYVQSKARAKSTSAKFVLMMNPLLKEDLSTKLRMYHGIENILASHCRNSNVPLQDSTVPDSLDPDSLMTPYSPNPADANAAHVFMTTAILLVNKYCAKLPSDAFTHLTARSNTTEVLSEDGNPMYVTTLRLPINSPVKETIQGPAMATRILSQMAVALKTCQILHQAGELDDNLMPIGKEMIKYEDEEGEWEEHELQGRARPGTTKRKQFYNKRIAKALLGHPLPNQPCYLYNISMKLTCKITEEQNTRGRVLHGPEETPRGFGILSLSKIPLVPHFPIFTRSGEVTTELDPIGQLSLSQDELEKLRRFHRSIYSSVLRLEKQPMEFNPESARASFIILPLNREVGKESLHIDWDFIKHVESCPPPTRSKLSAPQVRILTEEMKKEQAEELKKRPKFQFNQEDFVDAVVMPSYRNIDQPQYFYVAEIRHDLSPQSKFPSPELYNTFEDYYISKYALHITNPHQPLLDVDHTSARLNLLTPRYMNQKGVALPTSSAETRKNRRENLQQKQILIPELCDIHPFPASLWQKAVCIPAILYRINCLLVSEELRQIISAEAGIGITNMDSDFRFPELEFGISTKPTDGYRKDEKESANKFWDTILETERNDDGENAINDSPPTAPSIPSHLATESTSEKCLENENLSDEELTTEDIAILKSRNESQDFRTESSTDDRNIKKEDIVIEMKTKNAYNVNLEENISTNAPSENVPWVIDMQGLALDGGIQNVDIQNADIPNNEIDKGVQISELDEERLNIEPSASQNNCVGNIELNETHAKESSKAHREPSTVTDGFPGSSSRTDTCELAIQKTSSYDSKAEIPDTSQSKDQSSKVTDDSSKTATSHFRSKPFGPFDSPIQLDTFIGPSPCTILQTLTMSNANDFFNLERLETIGDSFLKFAITVYLYCTYPGIHEGKLSFLRSKQVSNYNLYKLGKRRGFPECMVAAKFEPAENWLPPGYIVNVHPRTLVDKTKKPIDSPELGDKPVSSMEENLNEDAARENIAEISAADAKETDNFESEMAKVIRLEQEEKIEIMAQDCVIPYNLQTQHSLPDKSIADCAEALIGCYLKFCGQQGALQFMSWLGLKVLSSSENKVQANSTSALQPPASPLLMHVDGAENQLQHLLYGFEEFEREIKYSFRDKAYLLQAFTHASYHYNNVTDCYQRLEFLGDAILDYVITRHLFEDPEKHSPGILTDLRSALVNNNIFAALAVKWNFHRYFCALSPQLFSVINKFVSWQKEKGDDVCLEEECLDEEEEDSGCGEDIEIPKALGDIFESVAGAIYLDSGMSLDTVWTVYYRLMKPQIDAYTACIPKSPVRELLELEPETAKFAKPERTLDGKIRVSVNVVGKGRFQGKGRNYRIAKSAAARRALSVIRQLQEQALKEASMLSAGMMQQPSAVFHSYNFMNTGI